MGRSIRPSGSVSAGRTRLCDTTYDVLKHGIVVAVLHELRVVPVDETSSPLDRALSIARQTGRPKRQHDSGRRLGVIVLLRSAVVRVAPLQCSHDVAVDRPGELIRLPVDLVHVCVLLSVIDSKLLHVFIYACQLLLLQ